MFELKKFISFFLEPMNIGIVLGLVGIYFLLRKNTYKSNRFFLLSFLWIALIHWLPFSYMLMKPLERYYPSLLDAPNVKYIHVLGSGHKSDKTLSIVSQDGKVALIRLNEAIRLYHQIDGVKLITSGHNSNDTISQAIMQKNVAISLGVKEEDIIAFPEPRDTRAEAQAVKSIVKDQEFILVTSAAHMPRSIAIFERAGLFPIPAPTDFLTNTRIEYHRFSSNELAMTHSAFHEYIGLVYYKLRGYI